MDFTIFNDKKSLSCADEIHGLTLPWGVDLSEGGWATDFAVCIIAFLFFVSSMVSKHYENHKYFRWMFLGTAIAHFFGGLCHKYYFNRASDGIGQPGFYVTMGLGYIGNCLRYGYGWGLGEMWNKVAVLNLVLLFATGLWTIATMKKISNPCDGPPHDENASFLPDTFFGYAEILTLFGELVTAALYLSRNVGNLYVTCAVASDYIGWISVYVPGGLYKIGFIEQYDPSVLQRIFHYFMIVMMWSISSVVLESSSTRTSDEGMDEERQTLTGYGSVVSS